MSYLNISPAAWSLVLSKDPRINPKPATPESACSNLQDVVDADLPTSTAMQQQTNKHPSTVVTANVRNTVCMHIKCPHAQASREAFVTSSSGKAPDSQGKAAQQQSEVSAQDKDTASLPLELNVAAATNRVQAPAVWSPSSGEQPSRWLAAVHAPAWQDEAAAAARQAAAAHRHLLGLIEKRRAALLKELGRARDLDLKRLLQLVTTYTDDVQALLESGHESTLQAQQEHMQHVSATAAAAVDNSIEASLQAARQAHQQQMLLMQQSEAGRLEAARLSATQQLTATLKLLQQQTQQQLDQQAKELNHSWSVRCQVAAAAAEKELALRAHADTECTKLRAELAFAKREVANRRARWEKSTAGSIAGASSISGFNLNMSTAGSVSGALDGGGGRACSLVTGSTTSSGSVAALEVGGNGAGARSTTRPSQAE